VLILDDAKIKRYFELSCKVKGLGRGHVKKIKDQVRAEREERPLSAAGSSERAAI
jgi:hypothetical protein